MAVEEFFIREIEKIIHIEASQIKVLRKKEEPIRSLQQLLITSIEEFMFH